MSTDTHVLPVTVWLAAPDAEGRLLESGPAQEFRFTIARDEEGREFWPDRKNAEELRRLIACLGTPDYFFWQEDGGERRAVICYGYDVPMWPDHSPSIDLRWADSEAEGLRHEEAEIEHIFGGWPVERERREWQERKLAQIRERLKACNRRDCSWIVRR